ncbi:MAG: hypothetical protein QE494_14750 [Ramlibacter sp.]|uniref:hypothetical protein n=1 Tax=Ramlibacter sp. TaxID=1917967 RepID=UPI002603ECEF|nr:hypothetical protein [Ramlibacter sp.]MDH4377548.1 hypothetical protein [Ramlibacter sp.]
MTAPPATQTIRGSLAPLPKKAVAAKVNIATPSYGSQYAGAYVRSLYKLLSHPGLRELQFSFSDIDYADIVVARNYLISNFYFNKPDCTHILFWDDDMGFEPALVEAMLAQDKDVVGVVSPKRAIDLGRLHGQHDQAFTAAYARACDFIGTFSPVSVGGQPFVRMEQCGAGVLLISRRCLDVMVSKLPEIADTKRFKRLGFGDRFKTFITPFNKVELEDRELSEDFSFCHRWVKQCQGEIYASVAHPIEHVGQVTVKSRYADRGGL